jgi:hypothetical protein
MGGQNIEQSSTSNTDAPHQQDHQQQNQTSTIPATTPTTLESFPQPALSTQKALHQQLQKYPYQLPSSQEDEVLETETETGAETIDNMASSSPVHQHLNFITGNKNKLAEVQAILSGVIELQNQNVDLVEIQGTVEEVTKDKCRRAADAVCSVLLSSLEHIVCIISVNG